MASGSGLTRGALSLSHRGIDALRPAAEPYRVPDRRCIGLAVRVAPSGLKTWDLAFRIRGTGKVRRLSLGKVADVSLENARERANELTKAGRAGRDLIAEEKQTREAAASRVTLENLIDLYLCRRVSGRLRTASEIGRRLKRALVPLLHRYADDIRRRDIRELLDAVVDQGLEREAEKRRQTIGAMFRWALSQDLIETDPTNGLKGYDPGTPRDRVLSLEEMKVLWKWLDAGSSLPPDPADVLRLQLLLGCRCGEASGITAEEINQERWLWTLPPARSKNKRSRVTPIVGMAKQLLSRRLSLIRSGPLFTTENGKALSATNIGHFLLRRQSKLPVAKFSTHDLRRTVATQMAELGVGLEVIAAVVGHEVGVGRETRTLVRHYVRSDYIERKLAALQAWDGLVEAIISGSNSWQRYVPEQGERRTLTAQ